MAEGVSPGTNELKKPNPVEKEPVIPSARLQEPKDLSKPEVLEILEPEIPEPVKPRDTSDEIKINKAEIPAIETGDVALAMMGAPVYVARNEYVDEAPANEDELTQAEIEQLAARNDAFTGQSQSAQNKRMFSELSGSGNYDGVATLKKENGQEKYRSYDDILLANALMSAAQLQQAFEDYDRKSDAIIDESEDVVDNAEIVEQELRENALQANIMREEARDELDRLKAQRAAATDPAEQQALDAKIARQEQIVKFTDENYLTQERIRLEVQAQIEENKALREEILAEKASLRERLQGENLSEDERRSIQTQLESANDRLEELRQKNSDLAQKADRSSAVSNKMLEFTQDMNLDDNELNELIKMTDGDKELRGLIKDLATKTDGMQFTNKEGETLALSASSAGTYLDGRFDLFDLEQREYELNEKLKLDPDNPELLAEQEKLRLERQEIETALGVCLNPYAASNRIVRETAEYKAAEAAAYQADSAFNDASKNSVKIDGQVIYQENGQYVVQYMDGNKYSLNEFYGLNGDQERLRTMENEIAAQLGQGRTLGTDEISRLQRTKESAWDTLGEIEERKREETLQNSMKISGTTSVANQVETPGEPLNVPDMNGHFTAAVQQQPTLTNGLGQNLDAANDPNFNRSNGLNA